MGHISGSTGDHTAKRTTKFMAPTFTNAISETELSWSWFGPMRLSMAAVHWQE